MNKIIIGYTDVKDLYLCKFIEYLLKFKNVNIEWLLIKTQEEHDKCTFIFHGFPYKQESKFDKSNKLHVSMTGESCHYKLDVTNIVKIGLIEGLYFPYATIKMFDKSADLRKYKNIDRKYNIAYCNSHSITEREQMFDILCEKMDKCYALGKNCGRNSKHIKMPIAGHWNSEELIKKYSDFNFVFAMENKIEKGYVTEKIINAFESGAIPIYWGDSLVDTLFNPNTFINVNKFKSLNECAEYIKNLSKEKIHWMMCQPIFINNKIPDILRIGDYTNQYYKNISNMIYNHSIMQPLLAMLKE